MKSLPSTLPTALEEILHLRERNEALIAHLKLAVEDKVRAERSVDSALKEKYRAEFRYRTLLQETQVETDPSAALPPGEVVVMLPGARELRVIAGGKT